jgi:membrane protease YdiL (CAAX protease family)
MDEMPGHSPSDRDRLTPRVAGCAIAFIGFLAWVFSDFFLGFLTKFLPLTFRMLSLETASLVFVISLLFCALLWMPIAGRFSLDTIGLKPTIRSIRDLLFGLIYRLSGTGLVLLILSLAGGISFELESIPSLSRTVILGPMTWPVTIGIFALLAGEEEIVGRGFLYPLIKRSLGFWWALALSSIAFSSMHLLNPDFQWMPALGILLAGMFLALLRELTGNIYLAWGAHFGWNIGLIACGLPVSGFVVAIHPWGLHATAGGPAWITGGEFGPEGGVSGILACLVLAVTAFGIVSNRTK